MGPGPRPARTRLEEGQGPWRRRSGSPTVGDIPLPRPLCPVPLPPDSSASHFSGDSRGVDPLTGLHLPGKGTRSGLSCPHCTAAPKTNVPSARPRTASSPTRPSVCSTGFRCLKASPRNPPRDALTGTHPTALCPASSSHRPTVTLPLCSTMPPPACQCPSSLSQPSLLQSGHRSTPLATCTVHPNACHLSTLTSSGSAAVTSPLTLTRCQPCCSSTPPQQSPHRPAAH